MYKMIAETKNKKQALIRLLERGDAAALYNYFNRLSAESRSRFGPHPFDEATIRNICNDLPGDVNRYVAVDLSSGEIVAYMLIKPGMIEWDEKRYAQRSQYFSKDNAVTFAPSVADEWQSTGLGSKMYAVIENELREKGISNIILWGGVQATNKKAVNYYKKHGYKFIASFWHDGKDNYDMVKTIKETADEKLIS
jgi:diamine N-acetyltransferase